MSERTEQEKLVSTPIVVTVGGEKYDLKPLAYDQSDKWQDSIIDILTEEADKIKGIEAKGVNIPWHKVHSVLFVAKIRLICGYCEGFTVDDLRKRITRPEINIFWDAIMALEDIENDPFDAQKSWAMTLERKMNKELRKAQTEMIENKQMEEPEEKPKPPVKKKSRSRGRSAKSRQNSTPAPPKL